MGQAPLSLFVSGHLTPFSVTLNGKSLTARWCPLFWSCLIICSWEKKVLQLPLSLSIMHTDNTRAASHVSIYSVAMLSLDFLKSWDRQKRCTILCCRNQRGNLELREFCRMEQKIQKLKKSHFHSCDCTPLKILCKVMFLTHISFLSREFHMAFWSSQTFCYFHTPQCKQFLFFFLFFF